MTNNSDNNSEPNIYPVIELKKSLKRTIIQLQKAMDILNQNAPDDLPNLKVVEDLVKSSNALVDYLQLRSTEEKPSIKQEKSQDENRKINPSQTGEKSDKLEGKKVKVSPKKQFSLLTVKPNLWLIVVLIVSISFNIINLVNNPFLAKKNITIASNQEIIREKSEEIEIGNNIFLEDNIENNQDKSENPPVEKPYPMGENIFQEETQKSELEVKKNSHNDTDIYLQEDILLSDNQTNSREKNQSEEQKLVDSILLENANQITDMIEETENENINNNNEDIEREDEFSLFALSPEKYILKNIENQINNITKKYGENLILQVKANFSENSIVITLSEKWYNLNDNQQNNFANDIFNQVKSLDLYKFKLENTEGKVLARNAVVGDGIIIIP